MGFAVEINFVVCQEKKKRTRIKFIPGCYVRHHQVLLLIDPLQESALQTTIPPEWRPSFVSQPIDEVCTFRGGYGDFKSQVLRAGAPSLRLRRCAPVLAHGGCHCCSSRGISSRPFNGSVLSPRHPEREGGG